MQVMSINSFFFNHNPKLNHRQVKKPTPQMSLQTLCAGVRACLRVSLCILLLLYKARELHYHITKSFWQNITSGRFQENIW